jgi:hypothetical protein
MNTAAKTASHYTVMGHDANADAFITLDVSETMQDALEYRDLHGATDWEVWVVYTDATSDRIA